MQVFALCRGRKTCISLPLLGRDHHPFAFTVFLAGGGIKPGVTSGASDEPGFDVATDRVHGHICKLS